MLITLLLTLALQHPAQAMGFDQDKTVHHFSTAATGGSIEVDARDASDEASVSAIRMHLKHISEAFAKGDFSKPLLTHGETPDGVADLQRLKSSIRYKYEDTPHGGAVRISTSDAAALKAVHAFLEYQGASTTRNESATDLTGYTDTKKGSV